MKNLLLIVLIAAGLNSSAQKVSNKLSFQKGQKLEVVAQTNAVINQELMGNNMEMKVNSTITRSFDVENVANNAATIEHKIKRILFSFEGMGQTQSFDSEKEADLKSEMGKAMEKSLKNKYAFTVDENGTVVSVKADDNNPNKAKDEAGDMMSNMLAQFTEGLEMPKPGDATTFKILPAGGVTKGQSWTDSIKGEASGYTRYTVSDITDKEILVDYTSESKVKKVQDAMGMQATVVMNNKGGGKITLDKKTGLMKQKTITGEGTGSIEVAGQSIPMSTKVNSTITVNGL